LVVTDLQDFTLGCIEAQSTLSGKFHKATRKLNEAATAFRQAYAEQEAVLDDLAASEKMLAGRHLGSAVRLCRRLRRLPGGHSP
jgi:hypothetical protein